MCIARLTLPLLIAMIGTVPSPADASTGCNTRSCEQRVHARELAKNHGGCRTWKCIHRVRARNNPREIGRRMARHRNVPWHCVDRLIQRESGWRVTIANSSSGAYGLPQSLPGHKMARMGPDWRTNPRTQLRWFFWYVKVRHGGACGALAHSNARGWY